MVIYRFLGHVDALRDRYQLVLIDARRHGQSSKPHKPDAYSLSATVRDFTRVLDDCNIEKMTFWGYSMGGRMGFGMARYFVSRLSCLIIGGRSHDDHIATPPAS